METTDENESNSVASPAESVVSTGSKPYDEVSEVSPDVQSPSDDADSPHSDNAESPHSPDDESPHSPDDESDPSDDAESPHSPDDESDPLDDAESPHSPDDESHPSDDSESPHSPDDEPPPSDTKPTIMLAPTTKSSPDRDRTLLEEGTKTTPETTHIRSKDEADLEEGKQLFSEDKIGGGDTKMSRKKLLLGFGMALLVCFVAGFLGDYLTRKKRNEKNFSALSSSVNVTNPPTLSPTLSPTGTSAPSSVPTLSVAPTQSPQPSFRPTYAPTASPTKVPTASPSASPSAAPTISSAPTTSPSSAPTQDYVALIQDFLFGNYGIDLLTGGSVATTNNLAVEWLALEAKASMSVELNGKLLQRFSLLATDLSLQGAKNAGDSPRNAILRVNECDWRGIRCNSENWVKEVSWDHQPKGRNGSGTISPEVRHLVKELKVLDLSNNGLVGKIPEELYKLTKLEKLYLFKNQLEGTISAKIRDFDSITHLHLSHNKLSGKIPDQLKSDNDGIRPLQYFNLYRNKLTGTLPQDLKFRSCTYFDVGRNSLTGTLPRDIGEKFVSLRHLHLDHNEFVGTLPSSYNNVGNGRLESLSINHNKLTGVVPGERKMYNKLVQYTLHSNDFDGMGIETCRMEVPQGEMPELRADCDICICNGFFDLCSLQCYEKDEDALLGNNTFN